jgi:hypothetical protein
MLQAPGACHFVSFTLAVLTRGKGFPHCTVTKTEQQGVIMPNPKTTKTKKPSPPSTGANQPVATVRMFCQGLGDCFLITLPQGGARPYSILIDCGVAMGTGNADVIMPGVVRKIAALTGGIVDLLVITHEHWDHVSGFIQAAAEMTRDKIQFKHLWYAWTENPKDELARKLKAEHGKAKLAVARACQMAAHLKLDSASVKHLNALEGVLAFYGPGAALGADKGKGTLADAMATPRSLVGADRDESALDYLMPGQRLALPGASSGLAAGVKAYVLGPPHVEEKVERINPSKSDPETYEKQAHAAPAMGVSWAWMAAAMSADGNVAGLSRDSAEAANQRLSQPFDMAQCIELDHAAQYSFFEKHYFAAGMENDGRRIDGDWLWSGAQKLALHLENLTNNTSLVLAFELPQSKKVLLFAGDAQVGNWLSWHDQDYPADGGQKVTASQLLANTVLYKVGHHGSHNATLRAKGVELMTHSGLVAMLPVEQEAVTRLRYGEMPLVSLVKELGRRTEGRVLRLDEEWPNGKPPGEWTNLIPARRADESFSEGAGKRRLYMEYAVVDK